MEREIFSRLTEGLPYGWNCNTAYFVLWSYRSKTSWVVLCTVETFRLPLKISSLIRDLIHFSIDFPRWKAFIWGKVVLPAKRNIMPLGQSERSKWSREQAQNLILHIFFLIIMIIIRWTGIMFRDVPGCSGMFRNVPGCSMFLVLSTALTPWLV